MRTIKTGAIHELDVRRSRFICALARTGTEEQARAFIDDRRRAHRAATHHCTAYVLGERGEITRSGDDGEPAGTAGRPMLETLTNHGLTATTAVVTRYFGGTKLGTGGLARAYAQAVTDTIAHAGIVERRPVRTITLTVEHALAGRLARDLHASAYTPSATRYGTHAEIDVLVPAEDITAFEAWAAATTGGRATTRHGPTSHIEIDV